MCTFVIAADHIVNKKNLAAWLATNCRMSFHPQKSSMVYTILYLKIHQAEKLSMFGDMQCLVPNAGLGL